MAVSGRERTQIVAHVHPVPPLTAMRSTLIISARDAVRRYGYFDAYAARLAPALREALLRAVAGSWLPVALVSEHYAALDALGIPPTRQYEIGRYAFDRVRGTLLGTAARLATSAAADPWTALPHVARSWSRGFEGSSVAMWKTGVKDALLEVAAMPLLSSAYFRSALRGLCSGLMEMFCKRCLMVEGRDPGATNDTRRFVLQWV